MIALRWLLVLPAAILGGLVAQLLTILITAFVPYNEVSQTISSATVPMGAVLLGARAAPTYKIHVAGALVLLSVLFEGMALGWAVLGIGDFSPVVMALSVPLGLVGSVVALYVVYKQERRIHLH
jgi:membrane protease YdiL (CAAX protease family)